MTTSLCAHAYCGLKVKTSKTFLWGLKCSHVFHDRCVSQTARHHCPACHTVAPVRIWNPAAAHCHCFLANCKGHAEPQSVCTDCTPAFHSRLKSAATELYKQTSRPGTLVEVFQLFFSQATLLPEWIRLSNFSQETVMSINLLLQTKKAVHPVIAGIWKHAVMYFSTSPDIVVEGDLIWPTQYYYLHTLQSLPIAQYSVGTISKAAAIHLDQIAQRECIFTLWTRTHEGRQVSVHRCRDSGKVFYRRATQHTITSPETLLRAVNKKQSNGISLDEIWSEHEKAHEWMLSFVQTGKLVILEKRVYATDIVASLTGVTLTEGPDLTFHTC